ncbi:hypothetical protein FRC12_023069 [Ceratobasidium sp. 428]|nr:hypothetical protein FRC12_023069 [Ceratobasidium sp. 428]
MGEVDSTPSRPNTPKLGACVTIPFSISTNQARFRCPECLWADEASQPDYIVNNDPRVDLSLALTDSSVVLVVFYLGSLKVQAELLTRRLSANLAAFGVRVTQEMVALHQELGPQRAEQIRQEMLPRGAYHLVTLFLTDRDIFGRLPTSQNGNEGLQDLDDGAMIERHTNALTSLARDATSARLFLIPCGR